VHNEFEYEGTGNTFMQGGTWNASNGDPAQLKQPIQTLNTLQGGFGQNTLIGGNLSSAGYDAEKAPRWNVLNANPAEVLGPGQNGGKQDILQAGNAGATMKGGALGGDTFLGSSDPLSENDPSSVDPSIPSQYVMIAGQDENNLGPDTMKGGFGRYRFEWQEGAGPLTVKGNLLGGGSASSKEMDVWGSQANESWTISPASAGVEVGVQITGQDAAQKSIVQIEALSVQTVSVDADDRNNAGGESYTIDDLSTTGVSQVNVNLHQFLTNPDGNADHVVVNGPATSADVQQFTLATFTGQFGQNGQPVFSNQRTEMVVTGQVPPGNNPLGGSTFAYKVDTALPKSSDTLNLNTVGSNDTVEVMSTQPSQTQVLTGAGDNTITVGGNLRGLDDIEGPLVVDAGAGHDQLIFDERPSSNGDVVTLTTNLQPAQNPTLQGLQNSLLGQLSQLLSGPLGYVLRYKGEALPSRTTDFRPAYRFPIGMTFLASGGGDFSQGVSFLGPTSVSPSQIYVASLLPNTPTTVGTHGENDQVYVGFDGGPTGATSDPASTLDNLNSTLTVVDQNGATTSLTIDDQGTARPDMYIVGTGTIVRKTVPERIQYQSLGALDLVAPPHQNNTIEVLGTAQGTNTTVDVGDGNNGISVGAPVLHLVGPNPPVVGAPGNNSSGVAVLDEVLGPLNIHGGAGIDPLSIDDSAGGNAQAYQLHTGSLVRTGSPQVSINFDKISSLSFHATEDSGTNTITVDGTPAGVPVTVQAGGGTVALTVTSLDNIQGALTFQWSQGTKTLSVQDNGAAESADYQVLPNQIQRTGAAEIQFQDGSDPLARISLVAGQLHGAKVDIPETIAATPVTLSLGTAANQVLVSAAQEDLDSLQGQLSILGVSTTTAILDDQNGPAGRSYVLGAGSLLFNPALPPILLSSAAVTLNAAIASKASVSATASGEPVTLELGTGPNSVLVGSSSLGLQAILAPLTVNGQGGSNQLTLQDHSTVSATLTYVLTANSVSRPGAQVNYSHMTAVQLDGIPGTISYQVVSVDPTTQVTLAANGPTNTLIGPNTTNTWSITGTNSGTLDGTVAFTSIQNLVGGAGNNTFAFQNNASILGVIEGGSSGTSTLDYSADATGITVDLRTRTATATGGFSLIEDLVGSAAGSNTLVGPNSINTWSITGTNSGNIAGLNFSGIQNLTGGPSLDAFVFSAGASVTGRINGGGSGDWLDYAAYTTPVTVDLATASATGVGGGIANIQAVRGGQGGNTLTGNAQPNILIGGAGANTITGGAGPSILIGGGPSTLTAGSGDAILVGGTTVYDSSSIAHDLALESILAEWASSKSFPTRVNDIIHGGGLNGPNTLAWGVNAHDDGNAHTLIGGSGNDWFFKGAHDTVIPGAHEKGIFIVGKDVPTRLRRFEVLRTSLPHPPRFRPKGHHRR
jgi:hypothetical protein